MTGFSKHNPIWDQTRKTTLDGLVYEDDEVVIATDFECGNGRNIRKLGAAEYSLDVEPEPGEHLYSGWGYYFCFGVRNKRSDAARIRVRVDTPPPPEGVRRDLFAAQTKHAVLRRAGRFSQVDPAAIEGLPEGTAVRLTLDLPPGGDADPVLFASNYHWRPISELNAWLDGLGERQDATVSEYGRSHAGRPLRRIDIGPADAPRVVLAQTPQPSEMLGTWACHAVAEHLLSDDPQARRMRERQHVTLIPATNPDGTVLGLAVSHPLGRFPYFEADSVADDGPDALPELAALWRILKTERPWLFIEWHGNNWSRRPGHMLLRYRPSLMKDPARRRIWEEIDRRLEALPDTFHGNWTSWDEGGYQNTLGFMAATRLNCVAYMIKQHDKHPLAHSMAHAVECFTQALAAWED